MSSSLTQKKEMIKPMAKLAIVGARNAIISHLLEFLHLRGVKKDDITLLKAAGGNDELSFGDDTLRYANVAQADWDSFASVVFVADEVLAKDYIPQALKGKARVINATEAADFAFAPLVVSGAEVLKSAPLINYPHPLAAAALRALNVLKKYRIKTIRLSAYIGADMAGEEGMNELYNHTRRILMNDVPQDKRIFPKTLAFNVIPQAGSFIGEETEFEWMLNSQIKRGLGSEIKVHANCAIVPVFIGAGMFINAELDADADIDAAMGEFANARGIRLNDQQKDGGYATLTDAQGETDIFISRVRSDTTVDNGLGFWVSGDINLNAAADIAAILKSWKV